MRILSIQISVDQREELFSQLQKFSEKHYLEFQLSLYTRETASDTFFVVMQGKTFNISAFSNPIDRTELDFNFTADDSTNPPSKETVDELYNDLKVFLLEIQNVWIVSEK